MQHSLENALLVNHEAATNLMTLKQLLNETLQTVSTVLLIVKNWTLSKSLVTILLTVMLSWRWSFENCHDYDFKNFNIKLQLLIHCDWFHKLKYILWFNFILGSNFIFLCFGYGNVLQWFKTKENKIWTKDKIDPQHIQGGDKWRKVKKSMKPKFLKGWGERIWTKSHLWEGYECKIYFSFSFK